MVLELLTHFTPYSLHLSRREPVELFIQVKNPSAEEATLATIQLNTGPQLSLEENGATFRTEITAQPFQPAQRKEWYFSIFPKPNTPLGDNAVIVRVLEHLNNDPNLVKRKYIANLVLVARK